MESGLLQAAIPALPSVFRTLQVGALVASLGVLWSGVPPLTRVFGATIPVPEAGTPQPAPPPRALEEYAVIGSRNLFKDQEKAPERVAEPVIEKSRLELRLVGTMASASPELSVAVLEQQTGAAELEVVSIGDAVGGGQAKVVRIEQRRVVIEREGRLEAIELDLEEPTSSVPPSVLSRNRAGQRMRGQLLPRGLTSPAAVAAGGRAQPPRSPTAAAAAAAAAAARAAAAAAADDTGEDDDAEEN